MRRSRKETVAQLLKPDGTTEEIPSTQLRAGNLAVVTAGQVIPGDGDVVEGIPAVGAVWLAYTSGREGARGERGVRRWQRQQAGRASVPCMSAVCSDEDACLGTLLYGLFLPTGEEEM